MGKIFAFDLDDTLCYRPKDVEHLGGDKYHHCKPIQEMIDISNKLYDLTLSHLKEWGINHHGLFMGKLHYELLIDDKAMDLETAKKELVKL